MPCMSEPPTEREREESRLNDLLDEIGAETTRTRQAFPNHPRGWSLDKMARLLCEFCKSHDVTKQSLELQIWWRDHQKWDKKRKADEQAAVSRAEVRRRALAKLTKEEKKALGL